MKCINSKPPLHEKGNSSSSSSSKVKSDAFDVLWNRRLGELREFQLKNGHSDVPSIYSANRPLGTWAMNQRQQYRKLQNGERSSLSPERIAALEMLGFKWSLGKGVRSKDSSSKNQKKKETSKVAAAVEAAANNDEDKLCGKMPRSNKHQKPNDDGLLSLTDDLILIVFTFLPSPKCVLSYSLSSKRAHRIFKKFQERLLKDLYTYKFGIEEIKLQNNADPSSYWRNAWHDIYSFRRALKTQAILDEVILDSHNEELRHRKRLGILRASEEDEAIIYDNPSLGQSDMFCLGYFGMSKFNVALPLGSGSGIVQKEQVAVWGDFNGLRIIDESPSNIPIGESKLPCHILADNGFGQIMTFITPDPSSLSVNVPCMYLGCAAGAVLAIGAKVCPSTKKVKFDIVSASFSHANEVTALSWMPKSASSTSSNHSEHLISGGCDGKVYLYPNAFSSERHFDLNTRILCCTNKNDVPILSLASCKIKSQFDDLRVLITGDGSGNITVWKSQNFSCLEKEKDEMPTFFALKVYKSLDYCRITNLKVVRDSILVSGDTSGNVRVWDIVKSEGMKQTKEKGQSQKLPYLSIMFKIPAAHGGTIHNIDVIGDILLSTGGSDGFIRGWDLKQGDLIGSVSCHLGMSPGQIQRLPSTSVKSSVVGLFFNDDRSLVSLCRDGSIRVWNYGTVSERKIEFQIRKASWDFTTNEIEGGVIPAAAVLSNLAGKTTSALLIPHSNPPAEVLGLEDLKKIMTCNGNNHPSNEERKLRDCMRLSIIKAAYEHASNPDWRKFPETPFIGADGRVYRYIKKAFATFSGMRPCEKCRKASQGAYRCRLQMKHDSSDVDDPGHNSLNALRSAINQSTFKSPPINEIKIDKKLPSISSRKTGIGMANSVSLNSTTTKTTAKVWNCHKCGRKNAEKNKRCPACCAWKGGKRNMANTASKNKQEGKPCSFCQYPNETGARVCVMCHEVIVVGKTDPQGDEEDGDKGVKPRKDLRVHNSSKVETSAPPPLPPPPPPENSTNEWKCHKCDRKNLASSKRCKSCLSWKGGTRQFNFNRRKTNQKGG